MAAGLWRLAPCSELVRHPSMLGVTAHAVVPALKILNRLYSLLRPTLRALYQSEGQ